MIKQWRSIGRFISTQKDQSTVWLSSPLIHKYSSAQITPVTLDYLLTLHNDITECGLYVHKELPVRLARRVRAIERLPFIVGVNPYIRTVYDLYSNSFHKLLSTPQPTTIDTQQEFTNVLSSLVETHTEVIPSLAKGFMECGKYMSAREKQVFLDEMIHARIGIRVIAEHYLSLQSNVNMGVVDTQSTPHSILEGICDYVQHICEMNYGSSPNYTFHGDIKTTFCYINVHMEYIFMELVKNAMRATVEHSKAIKRTEHPPIDVTIVKHDDFVILRFRDQGGGISVQDEARVWEYSFTTVEQNDDFLHSQQQMVQSTGGPIAGLGFGLPMSRVYARYFGGSLELKSVAGHGTDAFLKFPNISSMTSKITI
jgi:signal transduction histidine kinase